MSGCIIFIKDVGNTSWFAGVFKKAFLIVY